MKTWKDIEKARERRLWLKEVVIPGATMVIVVLKMFPELGERIGQKCTEAKDFIVSKLKK